MAKGKYVVKIMTSGFHFRKSLRHPVQSRRNRPESHRFLTLENAEIFYRNEPLRYAGGRAALYKVMARGKLRRLA